MPRRPAQPQSAQSCPPGSRGSSAAASPRPAVRRRPVPKRLQSQRERPRLDVDERLEVIAHPDVELGVRRVVVLPNPRQQSHRAARRGASRSTVQPSCSRIRLKYPATRRRRQSRRRPPPRGTGRTSLGGPNHCWKDIADTAPSSADKMPHSGGAPGRAGALGRGRPVERARSTFLSGGGRHGVLVDLPGGLPPRDGRPPARRAGARQPLRQRRAARAAVEPDPDRGQERPRRTCGLAAPGPPPSGGSATARMIERHAIESRRHGMETRAGGPR